LLDGNVVAKANCFITLISLLSATMNKYHFMKEFKMKMITKHFVGKVL